MINNNIFIYAINHVREYYPEITHVVFFSLNVWNYYTDEMYAIPFDPTKVDYCILENAAESLAENDSFPFIYRVNK